MTQRTTLTIMLALALFTGLAFGQTANTLNLAAVGVSYGDSIAGTGLYAKSISAETGTYAFSAVDAVPVQGVRPITVTTNFSAGVAQRLMSIGKVQVFIPTSAGISYNGQNTGWAWTTGGLAVIPVKQSAWRVLPNVRVVKSSVSSGTGYQLIGGVLLGWGW